ncbi:hypothetical protein I307_02527 [Cryptococcus deuterogattii 99/473]|uniref:Uncharacterized protein n=1 Tax=Cryptococcus deuterogattii Ram5 TaxID=1296110 RepID=A0A0D0TVA8_9TREE|nr:hypothetical protein I309_02959 [Cryptococcus deuterogattii LA55]KIR32688.1 hypothetical protein I352_05116 [Cryptococcus deuterogattii MMRL2647]KIR39858.1 hypothetical protein I313_04332 [Cryptococcus deuterogattii Ram5]KIR70592.1 hypothetical protein I310_05440 [Cryptococcus deuterogattii CA1014]KIR90828.1 hypothetical protein I304_05480 [Cryptococcus deuterogattii CBS 10090]KIR97431.1 hypothetical protein L804_05115 [Cryptococcus deuterogattii 2001/935-1]KIY57854.1 hypothetical protein 
MAPTIHSYHASSHYYPKRDVAEQLTPNDTQKSHALAGITLPAGYLGSAFIGACLVACVRIKKDFEPRPIVIFTRSQGFDTNASKVACLILAFIWILTLWWARSSWVAWATIALMVALVLVCWLVAQSVALRFLILFIGVMSCFYAIDTLARKVNTSDASEYAHMIGCCGSRFWG